MSLYLIFRKFSMISAISQVRIFLNLFKKKIHAKAFPQKSLGQFKVQLVPKRTLKPAVILPTLALAKLTSGSSCCFIKRQANFIGDE